MAACAMFSAQPNAKASRQSRTGAAVCAAANPKATGQVGGQGCSISQSSASISNSIQGSSNSSSGKTNVAEGEYRIIEVADVTEQPGTQRLKLQAVKPAGAAFEVGLYAIEGLDLEPSYLWLREDDRSLFAQVSPGWGGTLLKGFEGEMDRLSDVQKAAQLSRLEQLAKTLPQPLPGLTVIEGVRWFDAEAAVLRGPSDVYLSAGRIAAITKPGQLPSVGPTQRIAGKGRTLLPGFVDMHAHLEATGLLLNLASGVTAVRDVGNSNADLAELRGRIDRGELLGPRVAANGFIEGKSPFSSQADFVPDNLPDALAAIDWYAAHGYRQLKLYNSIRPEWVKPMVAHARALGLRTGGHVPAFMTARQAVEAGFDELHHINQVTLNFLVSKTDDTRTLLRFNLPGDKAADLKLNDRRTQDFIALLKKKGTVVDPTMVAFEAQ